MSRGEVITSPSAKTLFLKALLGASVLMSWNFATSQKHRRNRATVVTRMYAFVYPHAPAQPLSTRGCAQVNVHISNCIWRGSSTLLVL